MSEIPGDWHWMSPDEQLRFTMSQPPEPEPGETPENDVPAVHYVSDSDTCRAADGQRNP